MTSFALLFARPDTGLTRLVTGVIALPVFYPVEILNAIALADVVVYLLFCLVWPAINAILFGLSYATLTI